MSDDGVSDCQYAVDDVTNDHPPKRPRSEDSAGFSGTDDTPREEARHEMLAEDSVAAASGADSKRESPQTPMSAAATTEVQTESPSKPPCPSVEWIAAKTARVVFPPSSSALLISGRGYVTCLRGSVCLHGFTLYNTSEQQRVPFDCPRRWSNWLTVSNSTCEELCIQVESLVLDDSEITGHNDTNEDLPKEMIVTYQATFELHQHPDDNADYHRPTIIPKEWELAAIEIVQDHECCMLANAKPLSTKKAPQQPPDRALAPFVVAVCGAKGVGKSTCLRYLLHSFLSQGSSTVAILDADLGQPELGPPGLVTLTSNVTVPLFSPPHMHMFLDQTEPNVFLKAPNTQQRAYFLAGTSSSQSDPSAYLESIASLTQQYWESLSGTNDCQKNVLLINLDGWVKGLGGELLVTLLKQTLQPNHVIQIQGLTASQQFDLSSQVPSPNTRLHVVPTFRQETYSNGDSRPIDNGVASPTARPAPLVTLPAHTFRTLRLCTYFLDNDISLWERISVKLSTPGIEDKALEIPNRLAALCPYVVPLESVTLLDPFNGSGPGPNPELHAWNATFVGLCHHNKQREDAPAWHLLPCVGLGLIRSIDVRQNLLYILSPLPPDQLKSVNILVKSQGMGLPIEMTFRGVEAESFPYMQMSRTTSSTETILGTAPIKSRNTIGRRPYQGHG